MLKKVLLCTMLLLPVNAWADGVADAKASADLSWSPLFSWTLPCAPLDFAQSLDGKKVFVLGDDAKVYIFAGDGKKLGEMPVDPSTSAIDIAPRGERVYLVSAANKTYASFDLNYKKEVDISESPVLGKENAPVTLVLFSDFECPWCSKLEPVVKELLVKNPNTLRVVFKHLPLNMHQYAESAALAAIAAQKQGKFWEMHDALFRTKNWNPGSIAEAAQAAGLNMQAFNQEMRNPEVRGRLAKDKNDAERADISATPSALINGWLVTDRSLAGMQAMIDRATGASTGAGTAASTPR